MAGPGGRLLAMRNDASTARGGPSSRSSSSPPKTDAGFAALYRTVEELKLLGPDFVSVTWGAGGSTRRKTVEIVIQIQQEIGITAMAHLSCIGSTPEQLAETLARLAAAGIENVLALGGDRAAGLRRAGRAPSRTRTSSRASSARAGSFCLGGACYPETHQLAPSPRTISRTWCARWTPASSS